MWRADVSSRETARYCSHATTVITSSCDQVVTKEGSHYCLSENIETSILTRLITFLLTCARCNDLHGVDRSVLNKSPPRLGHLLRLFILIKYILRFLARVVGDL